MYISKGISRTNGSICSRKLVFLIAKLREWFHSRYTKLIAVHTMSYISWPVVSAGKRTVVTSIMIGTCMCTHSHAYVHTEVHVFVHVFSFQADQTPRQDNYLSLILFRNSFNFSEWNFSSSRTFTSFSIICDRVTDFIDNVSSVKVRIFQTLPTWRYPLQFETLAIKSVTRSIPGRSDSILVWTLATEDCVNNLIPPETPWNIYLCSESISCSVCVYFLHDLSSFPP